MSVVRMLSLVFLVLLFQSSLASAADASANKPVAPAPGARKPATPAPMAWPADFPVNSDIKKLIVSSPFFKLPDGNYTAFESYDPDAIRTPGYRSSVHWERKISAVRVPATALCRLSLKEGGMHEHEHLSDAPVHIDAEWLSWAGLIDLSARAVSDRGQKWEKFPTAQYRYDTTQATRIDKLSGQPFPLTPGSTFGWELTFTTDTTLNNEKNEPVTDADESMSVWQTSCQVGKPGPASTLQPGLPGTEIPVVCTTTYLSGDLAEMHQEPGTYTRHWLDSAGCFVQFANYDLNK